MALCLCFMKDEQIGTRNGYISYPLCGVWELQPRVGCEICSGLVVSGASMLPSRFDATEETILIVFEARMQTYIVSFSLCG
jgi:hypothetical protein